MKEMNIPTYFISRSYTVKRGPITETNYNAEPQITVLTYVKKNRASRYKLVGKRFVSNMCLLQYSETFSQAYKGLM